MVESTIASVASVASVVHVGTCSFPYPCMIEVRSWRSEDRGEKDDESGGERGCDGAGGGRDCCWHARRSL